MAVCRTLGVARSNVHTRQARAPDWCDGRRARAQAADFELLAELRKHVLELLSYGYRRACALLNRQRMASGLPRVNHKRVYRLMAGNGLLLPKAPRRRQSSRLHTGKVAANASDQRWCSDGFEIKCDSGQTVTATFAKDCCDRRHPGLACLGGQGPAGRAGTRDAH
ncbi:MAG: Integrase catalytic region [Polaromonas sp.]|nr:Integrase catalytic region [Polaromonas sp.]